MVCFAEKSEVFGKYFLVMMSPESQAFPLSPCRSLLTRRPSHDNFPGLKRRMEGEKPLAMETPRDEPGARAPANVVATKI